MEEKATGNFQKLAVLLGLVLGPTLSGGAMISNFLARLTCTLSGAHVMLKPGFNGCEFGRDQTTPVLLILQHHPSLLSAALNRPLFR